MSIEKKRKKPVKNIGSRMKRDTADKWVETYKKYNSGGTHGWLYGKEILENLLDCGADGIWFFKGYNEDGEERLVLYPADEKGNIIKNEFKSLGAGGTSSEPADDGEECPPDCPGTED